MPDSNTRPVSLPGPLPPSRPKPRPGPSSLEQIKEQSHGLRGDLPETLRDETDHFAEAGRQVLKFHGIYQQDDRDDRKGGRTYSFMIRSRLPGGRVTAAQYLAHEALADRYGSHTLRITTRQGLQLHGVLKGDLRPTLQAINETMVTTLGACGDVVRNIMCSPVPSTDPTHVAIHDLARRLSDHLLPRTRAYHEVWLDGEKVYDGREETPEAPEDPIYGTRYLPRKFKIAIAPPGDNAVDVYTQDVGLLAVEEEGRLVGYNLLVGGGLGMTHRKPETFPRLADPLAFVTPEEVVPVVEQIIGIQRDHGDRVNRRHARMKYLVHDWGLDRFRDTLEARLGYALTPPRPTPPLELKLYLGWHPQGDGRWYLGLSVENGRIQDTGTNRLKTGLHAVVEAYGPDVHFTPSQDLLLTNVRAADRAGVEALLRAHGIPLEDELSNARKYAMACPALPTCGLAITESERVMPQVIDALEAELARLGLQEEQLTIRMTGCPNGCARPYVADLGFVGRSLDQYTVYVGGRQDGTRLNTPYRDLVPLDALVDAVRPLLVFFTRDRRPGESFGDFCHRVGIDRLQTFADTYGHATLPG